MGKCILLVNSYDGGEDLWEGFFTSLVRWWPGFDMPVLLNTQSKSFSYSGLAIKTLNLYKSGSKIAWSGRLMETLKQINEEYVLFFVDDDWLTGPVDTERFEQSVRFMDQYADAGNICFAPPGLDYKNDGRCPFLDRAPQKGDYRVNGQVTLWRKNVLLKFLRPHESVWDFETLGSRRSRRYPDKLYGLSKNAKPVFIYELRGMIFRGKWYNESVVKEIINDLNLSVDIEERGIYDEKKCDNALYEGRKIEGSIVKQYAYKINRWISKMKS